MKKIRARTCGGCYGYNDHGHQGGFCALGFDVTQIPSKPDVASTSTGEYWPHYCKPAEPCYKPMTAAKYVAAFRLAHDLK